MECHERKAKPMARYTTVLTARTQKTTVVSPALRNAANGTVDSNIRPFHTGQQQCHHPDTAPGRPEDEPTEPTECRYENCHQTGNEDHADDRGLTLVRCMGEQADICRTK